MFDSSGKLLSSVNIGPCECVIVAAVCKGLCVELNRIKEAKV